MGKPRGTKVGVKPLGSTLVGLSFFLKRVYAAVAQVEHSLAALTLTIRVSNFREQSNPTKKKQFMWI
jgi:hypothetical protein